LAGWGLYGRPYDAAVITTLAFLASLVCSHPALADARANPAQTATIAESESYLGLRVRDIANLGCFVSWVDAGPLHGEGISSDVLARPDLLVSIDGKAASASVLREAVAAKKPGDSLTLAYRRSKDRGPAFPTALNHQEAIETLSVALGRRDEWTGTIGLMKRPSAERPLPDASFFDTAPVEKAFAAEPSCRQALDRLIAAQKAMCEETPDARRLGRVTAALTSPLCLPELSSDIMAPCSGELRPVRMAATLAADQLDALPPTCLEQGSVPVPGVQSAIYALDFFTSETRLHMQSALGDAYANEKLARASLSLAKGMRSSLLIGGPDARERFATIRRGAEIDMNGIVAAICHLDADLNIDPSVASSEPDEMPEDLPAELKGAFEGPILSIQPIPDIGWAIVGGPGANRYDMSKIAAVFDLGGDDTYTMSDLALGMRVIIDVSGNDRYVGGPDQGIACGVGGLFLVDDKAGDDTYSGSSFNAGAACFGAGLLIDRAGNDRYQGGVWSLGAACWGTGQLIDLGGSDSYRAEYLSEGCGGPRGFGAIIDDDGNDLYLADGPPSQYGTAATSSSFSQGVGIGIRHAAAGGIGLLHDRNGNDRYIAGEFAQGGGYYFGLGLLVDRDGDDRYFADRYGQGWAAHQASGILADGGGNDCYVARTAANQGAAWDQSTALLWDLSGCDSYQGDDLAQGSAAQQGIAFLIDGGGSDRYVAASADAQGHPGRNEYHFDQAPPIGGVHSFSLFLDLVGAAGASESDLFSTGRAPGTTIRLGKADGTPTGASKLEGLFIDVRP
jgi:hypothetical protein